MTSPPAHAHSSSTQRFFTSQIRTRIMYRRSSSIIALIAIAGTLSLSACGGKPKDTDANAAKSGKDGASAAATHRVAVETKTVGRDKFSQRLKLFGQFKPTHTARVAVEMPGRVIDLRAEEGGRVEAGATLIRQDSTIIRAQLAQADAGVAQADAAVATARNQLNRSEKLARSKVLDQARLDAARLGYKQAKASRGVAVAARKLVRANLKKLQIKAPLSGTVVQKSIEIGEVANPGAPLLMLADFSSVKLLVDVPEQNVARVRLGAKIPLKVAALGNRAFSGVVSRIPMQADARNRTFSVEIKVSNPKGELRGGMTAQVDLLLEQRNQQVVIPLAAVIDEPTATLSKITSVVFVVKDGVARRIPVLTGPMQGRSVLIESGLTGGEDLIVVGQRRVVDGDKVRITRSDKATANTVKNGTPQRADTAEKQPESSANPKKTL